MPNPPDAHQNYNPKLPTTLLTKLETNQGKTVYVEYEGKIWMGSIRRYESSFEVYFRSDDLQRMVSFGYYPNNNEKFINAEPSVPDAIAFVENFQPVQPTDPRISNITEIQGSFETQKRILPPNLLEKISANTGQNIFLKYENDVWIATITTFPNADDFSFSATPPDRRTSPIDFQYIPSLGGIIKESPNLSTVLLFIHGFELANESEKHPVYFLVESYA